MAVHRWGGDAPPFAVASAITGRMDESTRNAIRWLIWAFEAGSGSLTPGGEAARALWDATGGALKGVGVLPDTVPPVLYVPRRGGPGAVGSRPLDMLIPATFDEALKRYRATLSRVEGLTLALQEPYITSDGRFATKGRLSGVVWLDAQGREQPAHSPPEAARSWLKAAARDGVNATFPSSSEGLTLTTARAHAPLTPPKAFPDCLSAQQPCPGPSMGKRRVTASSPPGPVSSA